MGGIGSSRWRAYKKRSTVEQCRIINADRLTRQFILQKGIHRQDRLVWRNRRTGREMFTVEYEVDTTDIAEAWLRLCYTTEGHEIEFYVGLQVTDLHAGGQRWWFECSMCSRRVGRLYLPPNGQYFDCRHCHRLTYRSSQASRKRKRQR